MLNFNCAVGSLPEIFWFLLLDPVQRAQSWTLVPLFASATARENEQRTFSWKQFNLESTSWPMEFICFNNAQKRRPNVCRCFVNFVHEQSTARRFFDKPTKQRGTSRLSLPKERYLKGMPILASGRYSLKRFACATIMDHASDNVFATSRFCGQQDVAGPFALPKTVDVPQRVASPIRSRQVDHTRIIFTKPGLRCKPRQTETESPRRLRGRIRIRFPKRMLRLNCKL